MDDKKKFQEITKAINDPYVMAKLRSTKDNIEWRQVLVKEMKKRGVDL